MIEARIINNPFTVYEPVDVRLEILPGRILKTGDKIDVRFPNSWTIGNDPSFTKELQTEDPNGKDYVYVETQSEGARFSIRIYCADYFTGREPSRHGRNIELVLAEGEVPQGEPVILQFKKTRASRIAEIEEVYIALNGERIPAFPEIVTMPGEHYMMRIIVPSSAKPGEEFQVNIVSLDMFFNLSSTRHENLCLLDESGHVVVDNMTFTGRTTVETSLNEKGVYRFRIGDTLSNPIKISKTFKGPYWGDIHIHSRLSIDAIGRYPYRYARKTSCLDFAACADHEVGLYEEAWRLTKEQAEEEQIEGSFVTILAYEAAVQYPDGHHNIYYYGNDAEAPPAGSALRISKKWPKLKTGEAITIPHHTGIGWNSGKLETSTAIDFTADDLGFRNSMEIYSQHGQSELYDPYHCLAYEINRAHNEGKRVNLSVAGPFYARDAWAMGKRLGVIASSDDHYGQGGKPFHGIAAVYAPQLDRKSVLDFINAARSYATTGERVLVEFSVNSAKMGHTLNVKPDEELKITIEVHGTSPICNLEVFKYCSAAGIYQLVKRYMPMKLDFSDEFIDVPGGNCLYYLRLAQKELVEHRRSMAWTSPIWVQIQ